MARLSLFDVSKTFCPHCMEETEHFWQANCRRCGQKLVLLMEWNMVPTCDLCKKGLFSDEEDFCPNCDHPISEVKKAVIAKMIKLAKEIRPRPTEKEKAGLDSDEVFVGDSMRKPTAGFSREDFAIIIGRSVVIGLKAGLEVKKDYLFVGKVAYADLETVTFSEGLLSELEFGGIHGHGHLHIYGGWKIENFRVPYAAIDSLQLRKEDSQTQTPWR